MIPKLHYISQGASSKEQLENIQKACNSGIELVQLDLATFSDKKGLALAQKAREITSHFQTRLIITDDYKMARAIKADGVFVAQAAICPMKARIHAYTWQSIGAAATTLEDCKALLEKQVDYIGLGPFKGTTTKDTIDSVIGLQAYTTIIKTLKTETPFIGFGEITIEDVKDILETGISGIAVSQAITQDFNNIQTFNQLLKASATEEQRYTFKK